MHKTSGVERTTGKRRRFTNWVRSGAVYTYDVKSDSEYDVKYDLYAAQIRIRFFISRQLQSSVYAFQQKLFDSYIAGHL
jgi:hypothetical protein